MWYVYFSLHADKNNHYSIFYIWINKFKNQDSEFVFSENTVFAKNKNQAKL